LIPSLIEAFMALISIQDVSYGFGGAPILEGVNLQIEKGERLCLLGRNGEGKSTLMRLISGEILPDAGEIVRPKGIRIARLPQEVPREMPGTVYDLVSLAAGDETGQSAYRPEPHLVNAALTQFQLNPEARCAGLSAGQKRQALLARAFACLPDLLLLDEPTNHLDIIAIGKLETELLRSGGTLVLVTHDRVFLQKLATVIVDMDRGRVTRWPCNYETYLVRKEAALQAEATAAAQFDKKLSQEEAWIRQGVKARRTRNEGRVRVLEKMREMRKARRERQGNVAMSVQVADRTGKLVIEAHEIGYEYDGSPIIENFSTTVLRGDRVGIMGPNGAGKTTLLNLLLGRLLPTKGSIRHGTGLEIAYFDQLRGQLDEEKSVRENVGDGKDTVRVNGRPRHIIGYLKDFLFTPDRANSPVRVLSGGERNRLLLAKLFTRPSNVLVLDEPTNDLDAETLELLEDVLLDYPGTVLMVSHDRSFLNNVVTSTLAFEVDGRIGEYVGGYDDWLRQRPELKLQKPKKASEDTVGARRAVPLQASPRKLTFNEERELAALPQRIEALEAEQQALFSAMAEPEFYRRESADIVAIKKRLSELESTLEDAYERWEALEAIRDIARGS
jgi:ABC transport system ATP-binding/permease protein